MMTGWDLDRERAVRLAKLLPFSLYGEDPYIGLKAAARWSLASHAHTHPIIFELCESEAAKRIGRCRTLLLEIVAKESAQEDPGKAFGALQESFTSYPATELRYWDKANAEWQRLSSLSLDSASPSPDARQAALRCIRATAAADTYRAKRLLVTNADKGVPYAIHQGQFAQRVFQTLWEESGEVYDEWITTRAVHFRAPMWINFAERSNRTLNSILTATSYYRLLRRRKPDKFGAYLWEGSQYLCFEHKNVPAHLAVPLPFWARFTSFRVGYDARLWADFDTGRLAKVVLTSKPSRSGREREEITHFFSCYDDPVSIVPPAFSLLGAAEQRSTVIPPEMNPVEEASAGSVEGTEDKMDPHRCQKCGAPLGEGISVCFECR
jgi:hypothetical protein